MNSKHCWLLCTPVIMARLQITVIIFALCATPNLVVADGDCSADESCRNKTTALHLKIGAIASIFAASTIGVCLPIVGRSFKALKPDRDVFFVIKAFAAGVILATGFVHILPDAFESLSNECLKENPWQKFPFAGFVAMMAAVITLIIDSMATGYYEREHARKQQPKVGVEQTSDREIGLNDSQTEQHHNHGHGHGHGHGTTSEDSGSTLIRHRVISQVLELGIVAHSVIIGISMGASGSPCTIRPLIAALTFHQFFEGIGLGGCIVQAAFSRRSTAIMAFFFSVTTPFGIALGIALSSAYNENSPTALTVEGLFDAASAGILIYMALVDLLAPDFINKRMQTNVALQLWSYTALFLGIGSMSLIAKWA